MNAKLYRILACCLLFTGTMAQAQTDKNDLDVIRSVHEGELYKAEKTGTSVSYVGKLLNWDWLKKKLSEERTFGQGKDTISLSEEEKQSLLAQVDQNQNFTWPDHLLPNSTRILVSSEVEYEAMLKQEQQKAAPGTHGYVYIFSRPLYLRNGNVALVGFGKMCGTDCNRNEEVAFYRKEGGKWSRWAVICKRKTEGGSCIKQNIAQK